MAVHFYVSIGHCVCGSTLVCVAVRFYVSIVHCVWGSMLVYVAVRFYVSIVHCVSSMGLAAEIRPCLVLWLLRVQGGLHRRHDMKTQYLRPKM